MRSPRAKDSRNIAKFKEICVIPSLSAFAISWVTMSSVTPDIAAGERRMRSKETSRRPHGTKDRRPHTSPFAVCAVTITVRPSRGSPILPEAMEKPRSGPPRRHTSAILTSSASSSAGISDWRRTCTRYPAFVGPAIALRTARNAGFASLKEATSMTASSPRTIALRPCARYALAPSSLAEMTPGTQP